MPEEAISHEFRLKIIRWNKRLFPWKNKANWMSKKHKKVCTTLNYVAHFLILAFTVTGCISIFPFAFLIKIPIEITSSAFGWTICVITARIKKYKKSQ